MESDDADSVDADAPAELTFTLTGLCSNTHYTVAVVAVNVVGTGPVGEWSDPHWTLGPPTVRMVSPPL